MRETADNGTVDIDAEVAKLEAKSTKLLRDTYAKLSPWQKAQVARHPERPHFKDYLAGIADDFLPLAGDRAFADDPAIVGGLARIDGRRVMLIGHEKGDDTASRLKHNFGMAKPEGYRKAIRLMQLADQFGLPVVSLVDTPGAFPGVEAEERGQAEAIARSTEACLALKVPMIAAIVGEGGSGGAVAHRGSQPRADVRERHLFGHFAGGLRLDSVAHRRQGGRSRGSDEDHRGRSAGAGRRRPRCRPSPSAARNAIRRPPSERLRER